MKLVKNVDPNQQYLCSISECTPVFAKKQGKVVGMIVKETVGWILRTGGDSGCCGWHETRSKCFDSASGYGHEFFIEN